jgi:hypothetical protein
MQRLRTLGISLMALFALGALASASAWASGAPENTALPRIATEPIEAFSSVKGEAGSWTNSPTSFKYEWKRCNASGGECVKIAGALKGTYVAAEADVGHTLVLQVTAINETGQGVASSLHSVVVAPLKTPEIVPAPTEKSPLLFESEAIYGFQAFNFTFECTAKINGRFVNANTAKKITIAWTHCSGGRPSFTAEALEASLGYINGGKGIALRMRPEAVGSEFWASHFYEGFSNDTLDGVLFGELTPVASPTFTLGLKYTTLFEGGHYRQSLLGFEKPHEEKQLRYGEACQSECWVNVSASPQISLSRKVEIR